MSNFTDEYKASVEAAVSAETDKLFGYTGLPKTVAPPENTAAEKTAATAVPADVPAAPQADAPQAGTSETDKLFGYKQEQGKALPRDIPNSQSAQANPDAPGDRPITTGDLDNVLESFGMGDLKVTDGSAHKAVKEFFAEAPKQALAGVGDAINNTVDLARDIGNAAGIPNYALQLFNKEGKFDPMFLNPDEVEAKGGMEPGMMPKVEEAETAAGGMLRSVSNFFTGFFTGSKVLKGVGMAKGVTQGMLAGAMADGITADPHQERLSVLLSEVPALGAIVPEYMADNDPRNESEWEGRIKNVIEGGILGGISEAGIRLLGKTIKGYKIAQNAPKLEKDAAATIADDIVSEEARRSAQDSIIDMPTREMAVDEMVAKADSEPLVSFRKKDVKKGTAAVDSKAAKAAVDEKGVPLSDAEGLSPEDVLTPEPEGVAYINHMRINSVEDVHSVIQNVADGMAKDGQMSFDAMKDASAEQYKNLNDLLGREIDRPFTAGEAVAARETLVSSAEGVAKLARQALLDTATPDDLFKFRKAMQVHEALNNVVLEGRKATARSLKSWDISVGTSKTRVKQINELMGKHGVDTKKLAEMVTDVNAAGGNVSRAIAKTLELGGKFADVHYQFWVNGLLSGPQTHMANAVSNLATTMMSIPERYITAGFDVLRGTGGDSLIEANARATGFFAGLQDGWNLMRGHTQNELLTASSKIERNPNAISAAAWGKPPESTVGRGLDFIGKAVGLPGWALQKGDNFFKGINYRMRIQEGAAKTALEEGLTGQAFKDRVADLVQNPTKAMRDVGVDFAQYQTFTNKPGAIATSISNITKNNRAMAYVTPFVNTPANILTYTFERTPLAFAMSKSRNALLGLEGGAAASEAWARMSAGSLLMAGMVAPTLSGRITGGGPSDPEERRTLEQTGWRPYSVKIGNRYYSYERLEPIGSLIGFSADFTTILGTASEEEAGNLLAAGLASFSKNLTNKTFVSGMVQLSDVISSDNPAKWEAYTRRMAAGLAQPAFSSLGKTVGNYFDPIKRDFKADTEHGYLAQIGAQLRETIPGWGVDAPPLRDMWGQPQSYAMGVPIEINSVSPIKVSERKDDKVNNLIADNKIVLSRPSRTFMGTKLTNEEYSEYCRISGEESKKYLDKLAKRGAFDKMSGGPDGQIALVIKRVLTQQRKAAGAKLMQDNPDIKMRIVAERKLQQAQLMGDEQRIKEAQQLKANGGIQPHR